MLEKGLLDKREVEVKVDPSLDQKVEIFSNVDMESFDINMDEIFSGFLPGRKKKRKK